MLNLAVCGCNRTLTLVNTMIIHSCWSVQQPLNVTEDN